MQVLILFSWKDWCSRCYQSCRFQYNPQSASSPEGWAWLFWVPTLGSSKDWELAQWSRISKAKEDNPRSPVAKNVPPRELSSVVIHSGNRLPCLANWVYKINPWGPTMSKCSCQEKHFSKEMDLTLCSPPDLAAFSSRTFFSLVITPHQPSRDGDPWNLLWATLHIFVMHL